MIIKYETKIGKNRIMLEFQHMSELHKWNAIYGNLSKKCDNCGSENIYLSYKNPQDNDFYMLQCKECGAEANFGIHKLDKGLYWKGEKMKVYQGNREHEEPLPDSTNADRKF